jgi:hypothetical protein
MRLTRIFVHAAFGAALAGAVACGSSTSGVQASIGPGGGSLSLASPAVTFDIPPGALATETMVSLRASTDTQSLLVTLEPAQLTLAKAGQLAVSLNGARHISSVTEVTFRGEQPIGLDLRVEDSSGASARLRLDHLTQVRLVTADGLDGGMAPGACREHDDDHDGEHHDGEDDDGEHHDGGVTDGGHHDGEHHDGGMDDDDDDRPDGGVVASTMECPAGFECDDGVCVVHGGNHEHEDDCRNTDGGTCHDDDHDGEHRDGGQEDDHRDGGHD